MAEFKDKLPLDGEVRVNWKHRPPEIGFYRGHLVGNPDRCAVSINGVAIWVGRDLLEKV